MEGFAAHVTMGDAVPPPGTPFRRVRMDDDMWNRLKEAAEEVDPELDRSKVIRQLVRWYIGDTDKLPDRPKHKKGRRAR